ncbi:MAG TPA: class I SAM-dependent rRNA methyltransferase [Usitatibacter sp.]|jgi:23S rRNA (cytosine1962-C5)-methyltransferase|nr:class I SAM-dependent rRNA methyltransferase [Usitatibacter sp.]
MDPRLVLKPGREKSLRHRHPWVFSGAVDSVQGEPGKGDTVAVHGKDGAFLAWAAYCDESQIRARAWSFEARDVIGEAFLRERLAAAIERRRILPMGSDAMRLVHGESDGLPGLVVDRYADTLVVQVLSAGAEHWRALWPSLLAQLTGAKAIYERSDVEVRGLEGLPARTGPMLGAAATVVRIQEDGIAYEVDVVNGQKTGFYLDQRDNRALAASLAAGRDVLNAFCYTGGFSLAALKGGAKHVTSLDTSEEALTAGRRHVEINALDPSRAEWLAADVFSQLRKLRDQNRKFGLVVLDPPKFAPTEKHVPNAARAYKDINLWAMKLLAPGGHLLTFSCSGAVSPDLFQKIVAGAAADARVDMQVRRHLGASLDHPVSIHFPEGEYLKGLWLQAS